jgi:hypothetical protein
MHPLRRLIHGKARHGHRRYGRGANAKEFAMTTRILITAAAVAALALSACSSDGMGSMGGGGGMGGMHGPRVGPDTTPGWAMMTPEERDQHRKDMQAAKTPEQCNAMMDKQHQQMAERAKQRGQTLPNAAVVRLGPGGTFTAYSEGGTYLLFDAAGYFTS